MDQLSFSSVSTQTRKTKRTDIESPLSLSLENCEAPHSLDSLDEVSATLDNYLICSCGAVAGSFRRKINEEKFNDPIGHDIKPLVVQLLYLWLKYNLI